MGRSPLLAALLTALVWMPIPAVRADPAEALERLEVKEGWLSSETLLQLPSWMALGVSYTAEPMANPLGGSQRQGSWLGQTSASLSIGRGLARPLEQWREADHWSVTASVTHTSGDPLFSEAIGALFPLQQIAYPSGFLLSEASLSRSAGNGWLGIKAGIVPLNPEFMAAPVFDNYVHSAFNNTLNIAVNGMPINPYASLGGIVTLQPSPQLTLRYGWFDLDSSRPLAEWMGGPAPYSGIATGSAQLLQLNWTPPGLAPPDDLPLAACRSPAGIVRRRPNCGTSVLVENRLPGALLSLGGFSTTSQGDGVYASATLRSGLPIGLDERLWLGGAWSRGEAGLVSPSFVAGGLVVQGPLPQRPLDLLVFGAGRAGLRPGAISAWPSTYEGMLELGYQLQVNRSLALQPTLQWIINPSGGERPLPGILAAGVQLTLNF